MNRLHPLLNFLPRIRPQTRLHFVLLFPWFIPLLTYWLLGPVYLHDIRVFVPATLMNMSIAAVGITTLDYLTQRILNRYPNPAQAGHRVGWLFAAFMIVTPLIIVGGIFLYAHFNLFGYVYNPAGTFQVLLLNVGANILSVAIEETTYSLQKWRENALEREQLEQENLQSQYESLKNQVNPHFLFNSLNSLSSLIADDPEQAELFVDEMANVYRYLLLSNRTDEELDSQWCGVTTLKAELRFIESYFHLLKTRHRTGIEMLTDVPKSYLDHRLPPLTLQMLVENAVKHNVILASRPLRIRISVIPETGQLQVQNNLQPKTSWAERRSVVSNQVGLANIAAKYRLLAQTEPLINKEDGFFTVTLPLLTPVSYERFNR